MGQTKNKNDVELYPLGALCALSECNERAREQACASRKDAENAKESVKMWKRIRTKLS